MNNSRTLTLQNIAVWDTSERIDLIVEGVRQDALIEPNARICGEIDASDWIVAPGFADPHVHFRDPGQTDKETMMTGGNAAAGTVFAVSFERQWTASLGMMLLSMLKM